MDLPSITEHADRRPFQPFVIALDNGRQVLVEHSENIFFIPGRATLMHIEVYLPAEGNLVMFHPSAVTSIVVARNGNGR